MAIGNTDLQYDTYDVVIPPGKSMPILGLRRFVEILNSDNDFAEVTLNGSTYSKLPKGIIVAVPGNFTELTFRNPTVSPMTMLVATGAGLLQDNRLVIVSGTNIGITGAVSVTNDPSIPTVAAGFVNFLATQAAAANVEEEILPIATNINGLRIVAGWVKMDGAVADAELCSVYAKDGTGHKLGLMHCSGGSNAGYLAGAITIPAGFGLYRICTGNATSSKVGLGYEIK